MRHSAWFPPRPSYDTSTGTLQGGLFGGHSLSGPVKQTAIPKAIASGRNTRERDNQAQKRSRPTSHKNPAEIGARIEISNRLLFLSMKSSRVFADDPKSGYVIFEKRNLDHIFDKD